MHALSTGVASGWMAYPVVDQSNRGVAIYWLDIARVRRISASYNRGKSYLFNDDLSASEAVERGQLRNRPLRNRGRILDTRAFTVSNPRN